MQAVITDVRTRTMDEAPRPTAIVMEHGHAVASQVYPRSSRELALSSLKGALRSRLAMRLSRLAWGFPDSVTLT